MKKIHLAMMVTLVVTMLLSVSRNAFAQTKLAGSKITGAVIDDQAKPLDFATIILLRASDSTMVKTTMTDLAGKYLFENMAAGDYRVQATMVGYKKVKSKPFNLSVANPVIGIEQLQTSLDSKNLKEVSIVAQKPFIERKMDKLIMNVENSSVSAGTQPWRF